MLCSNCGSGAMRPKGDQVLACEQCGLLAADIENGVHAEAFFMPAGWQRAQS